MTRKIWIIIAILLLLAFVAAQIMSSVIPIVPSALVMGVLFLVLLFSFDRWLWKLPLMRRFGLVSMPDLAGTWRGGISSSYEEHSRVLPVDVQIEQRWLSLSIHLKGDVSTSDSIIAGFFPVPDKMGMLVYVYHARPMSGHEKDIDPHTGLCIQQIFTPDRLSGYYMYYDEVYKVVVRGQLVLERSDADNPGGEGLSL